MQAPGSRLPDMNINIQRDLKVAPDIDQIKHYLTVQTSIHLNGKVYRVLYYVPQNFIFNETRKTIKEVKQTPESLFSNSTFLARLNETIKRMANYAVAYDLGADENFVSISVDNKEIKKSTLNQETRKIRTSGEDLLKALTAEIAKPEQDEKRVALLKKLKQEVLKTIKASRSALAEGEAPSDSDVEDDKTSLKGKIDYVEDIFDEGFDTEVRQVLPSAEQDPDLDGFYVINTNPLTKEQRQLEEEFEEGIVNKEDFKLTPWQKFKDIFTNEKEKIAEKRYQARQAQKAQGVPSNLKAGAGVKKPAVAKEDSESDQEGQVPAPAAAGSKPVAPRKASEQDRSEREEEEQTPPSTPRKPAPKTPARSRLQTPAQTDVEDQAPVPPSRKASGAPKPPPAKKPADAASSDAEILKAAAKPSAKPPAPPPPPGSPKPPAAKAPAKEEAPPPPPRSADRGPPPPPPPPGSPSPEAKPAAVNKGPPPPPPPRSDDEQNSSPVAAVEPRADDVDPESPPSGHESPDEGDEAEKNSAALSAKAPAAANAPDEAKAQESEPEPGSMAAQLKAKKAAGLKPAKERELPPAAPKKEGKEDISSSLQSLVAKKAAAQRKAVHGEGDEGKTDDEKWSDTPKESKP
jgi:hypothetical protein